MIHRESQTRLRVTVTNAAGNRVDDGKIAVDPHNAQELHVALQPLAPVVYEVHWHRRSLPTSIGRRASSASSWRPIERYLRP